MKRVLIFLMSTSLLMTGCTAVPSPTPLHPGNTQLAADKLRSSSLQNPVFLTLPGMDEVTVANVPYAEGLSMDVYYPPGFDFSVATPAVIFVFGIPDANAMQRVGSIFKEMGQYISWGQLVAASGMVAVTYEDGQDPLSATHQLLAYLSSNGPWLGIDAGRLCLWSGSSHSPVALDVLTDTTLDYRDSLSCGVVYYGDTTTTRPLRPEVPLLLVEAGQDDPELNRQIAAFVDGARHAGVQVELVVYDQGLHGFEVSQDTDETHDVIRRTLEFMKANLAP